MSGMVSVTAASYDDVDAALAALESIKVAHRHIGKSDDLDAAVITKDADGKVEVVRRHDERTHQEAARGAGWGLALGALAALFPAVGIVGALAVGGGAGAALGAASGHAQRAMSGDDLKALGEVLEAGDAGLIVVHGPDMADRVSSSVEQAKRHVRRTTDFSFEEVATQMRAAEDAATTH